MMNLLEKAKIMTFTNFKAFDQTDFRSLDIDQLQKYKDMFDGYSNEYGVLAYPNFTVIPQKKGVPIGRNSDDAMQYIELPGIYIESAYVAAGMMVGVQNVNKLEKNGLKIRPDHPSVRFDISDGKRVVTELNREMETNMRELEQEIRRRPFGFAFMGNSGQGAKNTYVVSACSLENENGVYKNIYQTLVKNAIEIIFDHYCNGVITKEKGDGFKETYIRPWMRDVHNENAERANSLLLYGESVDIDVSPDNELVIEIRFKKAQEVLKLKITSTAQPNKPTKE